MNHQQYFARLEQNRSVNGNARRSGLPNLQELLTNVVAERYQRITGLTIAIVAVDRRTAGNGELPLPAPKHPLCEGCRLRGSWAEHLAELERNPGTHWHKCAHGRWCAVVPVVCQGSCMAACKLVRPETTSKAEFEQSVELLDVLVASFSAMYAGLLIELGSRSEVGTDRDPSNAAATPDARMHMQVRKAIDHIGRRMTDPKMTVASVARDLGINASYLGHIFCRQMGMRMSRYIAMRRIELAKELLATTNWQIKRVAYRSGHRSTGWFSQVFHEHTGVSPSEYRPLSRRSEVEG